MRKPRIALVYYSCPNLKEVIMAKFYTFSNVTVLTLREDGGIPDVPADVEYRVRSLGRGRWLVEDEDGYRRVLRTAAL